MLRETRGRIVNVTSVGGLVATPFLGPYAGSKYALEAFSDCLRTELRPWGIRTIAIEPGSIATEIWTSGKAIADDARDSMPPEAEKLYGKAMDATVRMSNEMGARGIPPEEAARVIHKALTVRRPKARYLVGRDAYAIKYMSRLLPDRVWDAMIRRALRLALSADRAADNRPCDGTAPRRSRGMQETLTAPATRAAAEPDKAAVAFEALYRSSRDDVYAYVAGLLRDRAAAEDVTALAFERAYRKRAKWDPGRGTRRAWLFGIARNAALDELRRRKRTAELAADPEDVDATPLEAEAEGALRRAALRDAMAGLDATRARADRAQVLRRPRQRRDRERDRRLRVERRHANPQDDREAEEGLR